MVKRARDQCGGRERKRTLVREGTGRSVRFNGILPLGGCNADGTNVGSELHQS